MPYYVYMMCIMLKIPEQWVILAQGSSEVKKKITL